MSARELIVLGSASMAPTRHRAHNSYALRWDDQLILFDPGEGTQRGCAVTGVSIAKATAVCITHFHGDHCLGLPGVIQRRSHENNASERPGGLDPLPVFYPADGEEYFDRLHHSTIFDDDSKLEKRPVPAAGIQGQLGPFTLRAEVLEHRDTTFGYRLEEPDGWSADAARLAAAGVQGEDVGVLLDQGWIDTPNGRVTADEVTVPKRGQAMAFVMDTMPCEGALELARDVDLLVCESTFLHAELDLAREHKHMTARQAAELATEAGARRVVLGHFSARYPTNDVFGQEASHFHDDVIVAEDGITVPVPHR